MIMVVDLSGGGEEYADASEGHKGGRDAYQAGQRFLRQNVVIIILCTLLSQATSSLSSQLHKYSHHHD